MATTLKFLEEARFAFGVMMLHVDGGRLLVGMRLVPFEYMGKTMLGITAFSKEVEKEVTRVSR